MLSLTVPARIVDVRLLTPDGHPVAFASEFYGQRLSTFRGGSRRVVLGMGEQSLRFQVPGFDPVLVSVLVAPNAPRALKVEHEFRW